MAKIHLEDIDRYEDESSVVKFKKKNNNSTKTKKVRKDKHRQKVD